MDEIDKTLIEGVVIFFQFFFVIVVLATFFNISANIRSMRRHFISDKEMKAQKKKAGDL